MTGKSHHVGCWLLDDVLEELCSNDLHRFSNSVESCVYKVV